ncbi:hypothetical protein N7U66_18330 [Lacinutrix neustonica]|uniref:YhhN-like protein n=1 Tax=Lacinutrix neustonica TaxID=2980107 RepID=A0A9E8SDJ4_9FLAO|nr:hypothetical protein [Lacinutrix neustonica]WAC01817.1 hypothetical protein N7U66_18330 [Lacinutrix neustonica]
MLIILTVILVLINFYIINSFGYFERRWIRLISIGCYVFVFFIFKGYKEKKIGIILLLLSTVDVLGLFYEYGLIDIIGPVVKLTAYLLIISEVIKKVKIKNINKPVTLFFIIVVLLNVLLVFQTVWATFLRMEDYAESVVYLFYGAVNVAACIVALNYNFIYGTRHSIYYLYLVFSLILSDASWFIGYYLNYTNAFYFDVLFYLLASCFLIIYALDTNKNEEVLLEE